jgi:hypothetical protein
MTPIQWFALVFLPAAIALAGYAAVRIFERQSAHRSTVPPSPDVPLPPRRTPVP